MEKMAEFCFLWVASTDAARSLVFINSLLFADNAHWLCILWTGGYKIVSSGLLIQLASTERIFDMHLIGLPLHATKRE